MTIADRKTRKRLRMGNPRKHPYCGAFFELNQYYHTVKVIAQGAGETTAFLLVGKCSEMKWQKVLKKLERGAC